MEYQAAAAASDTSFKLASDGAAVLTAAAERAAKLPDGQSSWALFGMASIFIGSVIGVSLPLLGQRGGHVGAYLGYALARAFAAGVVLATGLVHMLPSAMHALENPVLGLGDFPWAAVITTAAALFTNVIEFAAGQRLGNADSHSHGPTASDPFGASASEEAAQQRAEGSFPTAAAGSARGDAECSVYRWPRTCLHKSPLLETADSSLCLADEMERTGLLEGMPAGAARDTDHSRLDTIDDDEDEGWAAARRLAATQVLEIGIAMHSMLIGVALGASDAKGARPLALALTFHQSFEGFALGSALAAASYRGWEFGLRAASFAVSTPAGVVGGMLLRQSYSPHSRVALWVAGILNGTSAGILLYLALVNLVAVDFFSPMMRSASAQTQVLSYVALFSGAAAMAVLASWS